ncbi:MAG: hypothetical protein OEZ31_06365, partial [Nitrospirota bacterium]|nr:hypothetical protein [Nitrospirota bacterium]
MQRKKTRVEYFVWISLYLIGIFIVSCTKKDIDIQSYILRDRVIVIDRVLIKKALYVSFTMTKRLNELKDVNVQGKLFCNGSLLSESSYRTLSEHNGNLVFDLPYHIPEGWYTITIDAFNEQGNVIAKGNLTIERTALKSYFYSGSKTSVPVFEEIPYRRET